MHASRLVLARYSPQPPGSAPRLLDAAPARTAYDDPPPADPESADPPPADPPPEPPPAKKPPAKPRIEFSPEQQAYLNSLVAEEKRKSQAATQKVITQLETLKNQVGTTGAEKEALEARIDELKNTQLTQEELRKKDETKKEAKHRQELEAANQKAAHWENLFKTTTIQRQIIEAASQPGHKAHNPRHVVNELAPRTRLVEELDDEGRPTGTLIPKVKIATTGKDSKPVTLEMTVTEAVKWMSEQDEHATLFNSGAQGGLGSNPNNPGRRGRNSDEPPTDPAEYQEWRKKHKDYTGANLR